MPTTVAITTTTACTLLFPVPLIAAVTIWSSYNMKYLGADSVCRFDRVKWGFIFFFKSQAYPQHRESETPLPCLKSDHADSGYTLLFYPDINTMEEKSDEKCKDRWSSKLRYAQSARNVAIWRISSQLQTRYECILALAKRGEMLLQNTRKGTTQNPWSRPHDNRNLWATLVCSVQHCVLGL